MSLFYLVHVPLRSVLTVRLTGELVNVGSEQRWECVEQRSGSGYLPWRGSVLRTSLFESREEAEQSLDGLLTLNSLGECASTAAD